MRQVEVRLDATSESADVQKTTTFRRCALIDILGPYISYLSFAFY